MENNINIKDSMHPYLLQFNYALNNFSKFLEEEGKEKRKRRWHHAGRKTA